jgi:hypothetical protein
LSHRAAWSLPQFVEEVCVNGEAPALTPYS